VRLVPMRLLVEELNLEGLGNSRDGIKALLDDGNHAHSALFSEYGMHCVTAICSRVLDDAGASKDSADEPFLLFEEAWGETEKAFSFAGSSGVHVADSSMSTGPAAGNESFPESSKPADAAYATVTSLFALMPVIVARAESERHRYRTRGQVRIKDHVNTPTGKKGIASSMDVEGGGVGSVDLTLDYPSYCLLITVLYLSFNKYISHLECCAGDKVSMFVSDALLTSLTGAYVHASTVVEDAKYSSVVDTRSFLHAGPVIVQQFNASERLCVLYRHLEKHVLDAAHPVVALVGSTTLANLAAGTLLSKRIPSVMWSLLKSIHEYNEDSIFPCWGKEVEGTSGLLSHQLQSYVTAILTPIYRNDAELLLAHAENNAATARACRNLLTGAFATCLKPPQSASSSRSMAIRSEHEHFETFRLFWCSWWTHQQSHEDGRLYGTVLLLLQILCASGAEVAAAAEEAKRIAQKKEAKKSKKKGLVHTQQPPPAMPGEEKEGVGVGGNVAEVYDGIMRGVFSRHKASECVVRRVSDSNLEAYLTFALSFLPTLLLTAKPIDPSSDPACNKTVWGSKYDDYCKLGPYRPVVHALQMMTLFVREFARIICVPIALGNSATLLAHVIKVCKIYLPTIDVAVYSSISWRSRFELPPNTDIEHRDWMSVAYMQPLFAAALACIEEVWGLSDSVAAKILYAGDKIAVPRSISRSAPQLKVHADRAKSKLLRAASTQSIDDLRAGGHGDGTDSNLFDWIEMLQTRAMYYDSNCGSVIREASPTDAWAVVEQVRMLTAQHSGQKGSLASDNMLLHHPADEKQESEVQNRAGAFYVDARGDRSRWGDISGSESGGEDGLLCGSSGDEEDDGGDEDVSSSGRSVIAFDDNEDMEE
jgi:hypothetical protein